MNEIEKFLISEDFETIMETIFKEKDILLLSTIKKSKDITKDKMVNSINEFEKILSIIIETIKLKD